MIQVGQSLLDTFTSIEIQYPEGHGAAAGAQRDYQPINNRVTYRLKDREARADAAAGPLSLLGIRQAGPWRSATTGIGTRPTSAWMARALPGSAWC